MCAHLGVLRTAAGSLLLTRCGSNEMKDQLLLALKKFVQNVQLRQRKTQLQPMHHLILRLSRCHLKAQQLQDPKQHWRCELESGQDQHVQSHPAGLVWLLLQIRQNQARSVRRALKPPEWQACGAPRSESLSPRAPANKATCPQSDLQRTLPQRPNLLHRKRLLELARPK